MRIALLVAVIGTLVACSSTPPRRAKRPKPCPPPEAKVALTATERLNPAANGESRPVQVRVYQLQSDARLRNATFEEIWQNDQEALLTDLKSVAEYTVFPGKTQVVKLKRNPEAYFLALVALFREPQGKDWFVSYELQEAPTTPPCAKLAAIPVSLDRMQIQDGEGRADAAGKAAGPATAESAATENEAKTDKGGQ